MDFNILFIIDEIVNRYTEDYAIYNSKNLNVTLDAYLSEDDKEWVLSELDQKLPAGYTFSHTYDKYGKMRIEFKEIAVEL